ncbi:MAG: nucleotidyltransferase family protein [Acidobacteriia bacterium]|nr:nucleotidyltransferase family protein [Terriglobia bacterium]
MKVMLLAAGKGLRLGPATLSCPKPMLEIAGRPILEHNIRLCAKHGLRDLIINLHHCPDVITERFGDGRRFGVRIAYSREAEPLGTAGAVKKLAAEFTDTFLTLYADNLTTCDLSRLIAFHKAKGGAATIALFHREDASASGIAELDSHDRVLRFLEKPEPEEVFSHWVNAGILVLEPAVLPFIPAGRPCDFGRETLPALVTAGQPVYGYRMAEGLWWVDSPADLKRTRRAAQSGRIALPDP